MADTRAVTPVASLATASVTFHGEQLGLHCAFDVGFQLASSETQALQPTDGFIGVFSPNGCDDEVLFGALERVTGRLAVCDFIDKRDLTPGSAKHASFCLAEAH
jgi:hypothetical protein